jgi:hypothetical protein
MTIKIICPNFTPVSNSGPKVFRVSTPHALKRTAFRRARIQDHIAVQPPPLQHVGFTLRWKPVGHAVRLANVPFLFLETVEFLVSRFFFFAKPLLAHDSAMADVDDGEGGKCQARMLGNAHGSLAGAFPMAEESGLRSSKSSAMASYRSHTDGAAGADTP